MTDTALPVATPDELDAPVVPAGHADRLRRAARAEGIATAPLLAAAGLAADELARPGVRISTRAELDFLGGLVDAGLSRGAAVEARAARLDDYGLLGYAMMSCATLGDALRLALRYARTAGRLLEVHRRLDRGEVVLEAHDAIGLGRLRPFVVEPLFAGFPALFRALLGEAVPATEVRFGHAPSADAASLRDLFRAPVRYNAGQDEYRFAAPWLDRPLPRADADTARLCEASCRALLAELDAQPTLAARIARSLLARPGDVPTAPVMAERLNMSERTLRRRLADLGTSYQAVLDRVRRRLAEDYLRTTALPVQEIAELLGYSEATNFCRAFVKWTGASPGTFRRLDEARVPLADPVPATP